MTSLNSWHERPRKEKIPPPLEILFFVRDPVVPGGTLFSRYSLYIFLLSSRFRGKENQGTADTNRERLFYRFGRFEALRTYSSLPVDVKCGPTRGLK